MRKVVFFGCFSILLLLGIFVYQYFSFHDKRLHVIFCNVGQGDGVVIRDPDGVYFMVDSGPDERILRCLEKNMPFWRRDIAIAFLTHPHTDHFVGYLSVLRRYGIGTFIVERLENTTSAYKSLTKLLKDKRIQLRSSEVGDAYRTKSGLEFVVLGPSKEFVALTSPGGKIGESSEFANLVIHLRYKDFDILFTGDSQILGLSEALGSTTMRSFDVLHVPHHGSKTGLSQSILEDLGPKVAVISVGKNNYGHPSREVLGLLERQKIVYFRTDRHGDVEIVSDGAKFWIER
jgi:competence protein ComEC